MIDIHCHILPGIDDGPLTMEDSIKMAREAVRSGISTIVATPHLNRKYENTKPIILEKVQLLNSRLEEENINLSILPGQEISIYGEILKDMEADRIQSMCDTQYIFIELPPNQVPTYTERLIFDLQMKNLIPIIVHPERNSQFVKQPNMLYRLVRNGALTQITATSFVKGFGKELAKFCERIMDANLVHFVASDAHNVDSRGFKLKEAYDRIEDLYGSQYVRLFKENAECMVRGQNIQKLAPEKVEAKRFFGLFG